MDAAESGMARRISGILRRYGRNAHTAVSGNRTLSIPEFAGTGGSL